MKDVTAGTIGFYRTEKESYKDPNTNKSYKELLSEEYPEYFKFISGVHDKFDNLPYSEVSSGVDYGFYRYLIYRVLDWKPRHIVEYGPGFTTLFLHRILQDVDWEVKVYSYEDLDKWYKILTAQGFNPFGTLELVPLSVHDPEPSNREGLYYVTYEHDFEKHKDVDLVIIDGPGNVIYNGVEKRNINMNLEKLCKYTGRDINYIIDGRRETQAHYHNSFRTNKKE